MSDEPEPLFCEPGGGGYILPIGGDGEQKWPNGLRVVLYLLGLLWCFLGVAIISDVFMAAIETITSKKKRVFHKELGRYVTVKVWNDTVANLTLMALGSSAPEILLSVIELLMAEFFSGDLGPSTIVGSAAFNLLVIIAVCVSVIPAGDERKIKDMNVFAVTASFSLFAYIWLIIILQVITPDVVDFWEGFLTFLFFPILVTIAWMADKGMFSKKREEENMHIVRAEMSETELKERISVVRAESKKDLSEEKILHYLDLQMDSQRTNASRAARRVAASRGMTGGRRVKTKSFASNQQTDDTPSNKTPKAAVLIGFSCSSFTVLESAGHVILHVERSGDAQCAAKVQYRTRDGRAKAGEDYEKTEGELDFQAGETHKEIQVRIIDDNAYEDDEEFYVDLFRPTCPSGQSVELSNFSSAQVTIIDDDEPGILSFEKETLMVDSGNQDKVIYVDIKRRNGSTGDISCKYRTENASAVAPLDFDALEGELNFRHEESSQTISINIKASTKEKQELFRLILEEPTGGAKFAEDTDGGAESCICTIYIKPADGRSGSFINRDQVILGTANWKEQFTSALYCNGSPEEQAEASKLDWFLHILSLPWKLIFALVPPTDFGGGFVCFVVALMFIGGTTMIIGEMANMMGCTMGVPNAVTAITFVALGTSLPDTFASKSAAIDDPYADASVGNVTGSNSVNVFLGLGLPWTMGALYWETSGPDEKWRAKYPSVNDRYPEGRFAVIAGSLSFSVTAFTVCALSCISVLMFRRKLYGAELGGPVTPKYVSSAFFVFLWVSYIGVASSKFVAEEKGWDGDVNWNLVLIILVLVVLVIPLLVMGAAALLGGGQSKGSESAEDAGQQTSQAKVVEDDKEEHAIAAAKEIGRSPDAAAIDGSAQKAVEMACPQEECETSPIACRAEILEATLDHAHLVESSPNGKQQRNGNIAESLVSDKDICDLEFSEGNELPSKNILEKPPQSDPVSSPGAPQPLPEPEGVSGFTFCGSSPIACACLQKYSSSPS